MSQFSKRNSFTLIELLIVIAILAVLATAVVLVLNPAELVKGARDSTRLADLNTINKTLGLIQSDNPSIALGDATKVYISLASPNSDCSGLGLPTLPTGYVYKCASTSTLTKTDGTGWIPVNFNSFSSGNILSKLPIDPINTTTTGNYYTYMMGGSWQLATSLEASKNKLGGSNDLTSKDKGKFPSLYELGTNLTLLPIEYGDTSLVGYWSFEEGPNATSTDYSGYGNNGTWYGTTTNANRYGAGKVGNYSGSFNGSSDRISNISVVPNLNFDAAPFSLVGWVKIPQTQSQDAIILETSHYGANGYALFFRGPQQITFGTHNSGCGIQMGTNISLDEWIFVTATYNGSSAISGYKIFINGIEQAVGGFGVPKAVTPSSYSLMHFGMATQNSDSSAGSKFFSGYLDDVRIYNRVLSATEIKALHDATK